jgi:RNA polymerase sigma-70 factor (ECF subfamily)
MNRQEEDLKIIQGCMMGDQTCFYLLFSHYRKYIFRTILNIAKNKNDAEDLTMEVFEKVFTKFNYNPTSSFSSWLTTVARNYTYDFLKKQHLKYADTDVEKEVIPFFETPETLFIVEENKKDADQLSNILNKAIDSLDEHHRKIIRLRYYEDYSYIKIAKEMNLSVNLVKTRLLRAKKFLQKALSDKK